MSHLKVQRQRKFQFIVCYSIPVLYGCQYASLVGSFHSLSTALSRSPILSISLDALPIHFNMYYVHCNFNNFGIPNRNNYAVHCNNACRKSTILWVVTFRCQWVWNHCCKFYCWRIFRNVQILNTIVEAFGIVETVPFGYVRPVFWGLVNTV